MLEGDVKFLEETFKKYYFDHLDILYIPDRISEHEFGFQKFNSGMTRHISLKDERELRLLLMQNIPSDVYCSCARYSFPNLPMKEKDWKEADLIFDIDAKDLKLDCRENHMMTICSDCNSVSVGSRCTECNSTKLEHKSLPCKDCISAAKEEVKRLLDILVQDFAVDPKDTHVYFSGNDGFHVHVYNSQFQESGSQERAELVDYVMLNGSIPDTFGMTRSNSAKAQLPTLGELGWRGRFAKDVFRSKSNRSSMISKMKSDGYSSFQQTLDAVSKRIGVKVDPGVTMDVHRIFRLPGSLNSKSGMTKILCTDLDKFNPYVDALFLHDDKVEVVANCPSEFKLKNKKFGPYTNDTVTVPAYAAAYMICKKLAKIS